MGKMFAVQGQKSEFGSLASTLNKLINASIVVCTFNILSSWWWCGGGGLAKSGKAPKQPSQSSKFQVCLMWETLSQKYKVGNSRENHATLTSSLQPPPQPCKHVHLEGTDTQGHFLQLRMGLVTS